MEALLQNIRSGYAPILQSCGLRYRENKYYYLVGNPKQPQGWIIHLSVIHLQLAELLEKVLPDLAGSGAAFKVVKNRERAKELNLGTYGVNLIGKSVTIYPDSDEVALDLARAMISMGAGYEGPEVLTDLHLGNIVFTRYGSFNTFTARDSFGHINRVCIGSEGELVTDQYLIPARIPADKPFPFTSLIKYDACGLQKKISDHYLRTKVLKADVKGDVCMAVWLKMPWPRSCVIKEGKRNMVADDQGRTIKDRLLTQQALHRLLADRVPVPRMYDYFEHKGNGYLVIEYIKGTQDLLKRCYELLENRPWHRVSVAKKLDILSLLQQVMVIIAAVHKMGYVVRDLSGTNFILDRKNSIHLVDLELMYSPGDGRMPYPGGTLGFMSPQQLAQEEPSFEDDIYSIGALLISTLIPIWPSAIIEPARANLREKLDFFLDSRMLTELILSCLASDPGDRPGLAEIQSQLEIYRKSFLEAVAIPRPFNSDRCRLSIVEETLYKGLMGLQYGPKTGDGIWYCRHSGNLDITVNELEDKAILPGLYSGIAGVLYLLSQVKKTRLSSVIDGLIEKQNWDYLSSHFLQGGEPISEGLYYGRAGIALLLKHYRQTDGAPQPTQVREFGEGYFPRQCPGLDLLSGIAGQGLAACYCTTRLPEPATVQMRDATLSTLLRLQEKDGSWRFGNGERVFGLGYGIAGILYYLLVAANNEGIGEVERAAFKGLQYLEKKADRKKDAFIWPISDRNRQVNNWWCHGSPGIALTFVKAYELYGDIRHRIIAERALRSAPEDFVCYNLSQCHGLSGLGEVYLEAFRVLRSEEWWRRSSWIAESLVALKRINEKGHYEWYTEKPDFPTADLMTGNAGILHFLLRYCFTDRVNFPILAD